MSTPQKRVDDSNKVDVAFPNQNRWKAILNKNGDMRVNVCLSLYLESKTVLRVPVKRRSESKLAAVALSLLRADTCVAEWNDTGPRMTVDLSLSARGAIAKEKDKREDGSHRSYTLPPVKDQAEEPTQDLSPEPRVWMNAEDNPGTFFLYRKRPTEAKDARRAKASSTASMTECSSHGPDRSLYIDLGRSPVITLRVKPGEKLTRVVASYATNGHHAAMELTIGPHKKRSPEFSVQSSARPAKRRRRGQVQSRVWPSNTMKRKRNSDADTDTDGSKSSQSSARSSARTVKRRRISQVKPHAGPQQATVTKPTPAREGVEGHTRTGLKEQVITVTPKLHPKAAVLPDFTFSAPPCPCPGLHAMYNQHRLWTEGQVCDQVAGGVSLWSLINRPTTIYVD